MSSLGGSASSGNRSRSARTVSCVSSTDSVVCDSQASRAGSRTSRSATASGPDDEVHPLGRLTGRADDLLVALVADQQDVDVLAGEPPRLGVHLGDQRAGRVDRVQVAAGGLLVHDRRDAVRGEDDDGALRHLVGLVDEDRPARLEARHDMGVVHDLLADVDRLAVPLERSFDRLHRPIHPRAVAARGGEQHPAMHRLAATVTRPS